jgi:hypothetical protein
MALSPLNKLEHLLIIKKKIRKEKEQLSPLTLSICPKIISALRELSKDILDKDTHPGEEHLGKWFLWSQKVSTKENICHKDGHLS